MPLEILVILVVGGIAGIAALTYLFGLSATHEFRTGKDAASAWLREFPNDQVVTTTLCRSGAAALVHATSGVGLVWPMGADTTARSLKGAAIKDSKTGLTIHLSDFAAPHVSLTLTPDESLYWRKLIEATRD
ncbi:MAG: hypothetical protein N4A61_06580 [Pelagimonas sp.]|jgi:hypothetical protein|nr:hypothetical protein [Pelagimonas sp.]